MITEYGPNEISHISGLPALLRAYLDEGPWSYINNAQVRMRLLEVDGNFLPLIFANPKVCNADVCSPHSHYIRYSCEEIAKRNPRVPGLVFRMLFALWSQLIRKNWLDRALYVNNWLSATCPDARLSTDQVEAVTRYLKKRYPGVAIIFRSINPTLNQEISDSLHLGGYRLIPARTVYLLDVLPAELTSWKTNARRDINELRKGRFNIVRLGDIQRGEAQRLERLYRELYLDKHSQLNPHYNKRFFELVLTKNCMDGIFLQDGCQTVAMVLLQQDDNVLLANLLGYDLEYSRKDGVYRKIIATLILEAQSRGLVLNLSSGAGSFKTHRGAVATLEYEAVLTAGLPFYQRFAWALVEAQGKIWSRHLSDSY